MRAANPLAVTEALGTRSNLLPVKLDVTNEVQAQEAVNQAIARYGSIDVLINNAGFGVIGAIEEISGAEVEAVYRTNVFGLLAVTRAVMPQLRKQRPHHQHLVHRRLSELGGLGHLCFGKVCCRKHQRGAGNGGQAAGN